MLTIRMLRLVVAFTKLIFCLQPQADVPTPIPIHAVDCSLAACLNSCTLLADQCLRYRVCLIQLRSRLNCSLIPLGCGFEGLTPWKGPISVTDHRRPGALIPPARVRRLALFGTPWSPKVHPHFPDAFRAAARLLMLAATAAAPASPRAPPVPQQQASMPLAATSAADAAESAAVALTEAEGGTCMVGDQGELPSTPPAAPLGGCGGGSGGNLAGSGAAGWPLSADVTRCIIAAAAHPISAWVPN